MIAKLNGVIDYIADGYLVLDVHGVGYRVFCSEKTLYSLSVGQGASLWIETQVREDHIHLFGFISADEKEWFNTLTSVQGVGAKVGLAILSVLSCEEISLALACGDSKSLTRAAGVGPKLASRIVSELKGKSPIVNTSISISHISLENTVMDEAISALCNLGYSKSEVALCVGTIYGQDNQISLDKLISTALREIGKK